MNIPPPTLAVLNDFDDTLRPTADFEVSTKLSEVLRSEQLSPAGRQGAWIEAAAFDFRIGGESPWKTQDCAYRKSDLQPEAGTQSQKPDISIDVSGRSKWTPHERSASRLATRKMLPALARAKQNRLDPK
jgi:hypothetical protein